MKNKQLNKIKMYDTVQSVIVKHQTTWIGTPAFAEAYAAFTEKLDALKVVSSEHINSTKGLTILKQEVLDRTIDHALMLGNVLGALALKLGDTELLTRNLYKRSEWVKGNSLLKINRFKHVLADVVEHQEALADYGVDASIVSSFEANILHYEVLSKQTRTSIVGRKQMTLAIAQYIADIDELLNGQLARIIFVFEKADAKFVETFKNACNVVHQKGKRIKPKGEDLPPEPDDGKV